MEVGAVECATSMANRFDSLLQTVQSKNKTLGVLFINRVTNEMGLGGALAKGLPTFDLPGLVVGHPDLMGGADGPHFVSEQ